MRSTVRNRVALISVGGSRPSASAKKENIKLNTIIKVMEELTPVWSGVPA